MDSHRKVAAKSVDIVSLQPPFSFFDLAESKFEDCESIRRIFSLARSLGSEILILEAIPPVGIIAEENEDILQLYPTFCFGGLFRLSFWKKVFPDEGISGFENSDLVGYAILKKDLIGGDFDGWHIFEAVFSKYPHQNNCVPNPGKYGLLVCGKEFFVEGVLYCQQNSLNKACAQVAIRSLLSRLVPDGDVSYRRINAIASDINPKFVPRNGLNVKQIQKILDEFRIRYSDVDYSFDPEDPPDKIQRKQQLQKDLPYQKHAYSGLESGGGALVGFRCTDLRGNESKHIIPIYGHTFNKDTWAPDANFAYFRIGTTAGYVPSEIWTSSFIGHDDNFGPNFCIPRLYIGNDKVDYVLEVFKPGINYSGMEAEALALNIIYPLVANLDSATNSWLERLKMWVPYQRIVFRAIALNREEYINHLREIRDWEGNQEIPAICDFLSEEIPDVIWVVEISTSQLFPANKRKLGEIVFLGSGNITNPDGSLNSDLFSFARLPSVYMLGGKLDTGGAPQFTEVPSQLKSHTPLMRV